MDSLSDLMVKYRAKHRMTQPAFAEKAGISVQTVCNVETGQQNPSRITQAKILLAMEEEENEN